MMSNDEVDTEVTEIENHETVSVVGRVNTKQHEVGIFSRPIGFSLSFVVSYHPFY